MKRLFSFQELDKPAQIAARNHLLNEMETLYCRWKNVKAFIASASDTGVLVSPEDVYVSDDDNVIFLPHEVDIDVALQKSGVDKVYLSLPEYRELFLCNTKATIRQVSPFPSDVRFVLISVDVTPFENNDNGHAFLICEAAAAMLEIYLNHLVTTISNSFRATIIKEHSRISSPAFLDKYLADQGAIFLKDGSIAPFYEDEAEDDKEEVS